MIKPKTALKRQPAHAFLSHNRARRAFLQGGLSLSAVLLGETGFQATQNFTQAAASAAFPPDFGASASFVSFNYPGYYIRHRNFLGELTTLSSDLDNQDATFTMVNGLADPNLVSFQSNNYPGYYLRHQDFRVHLHPLPSSTDSTYLLFVQDATFYWTSGLKDVTDVSFRSYNYPDRFLRHRDFHLWVESISGEPGLSDATFSITAPRA